MLSNALLAGALSAAYLTVLVLQLNPHVPVLSATTWYWFLTLGATYGLHLAVGFYVVLVVREFFSMDALSPGWASVRVLAWLSAIGAAVAATLMWLNINAFSAVIGEVAARRMVVGAFATSASAVVLVGIAIAHYSYGRRGSGVGGALFTLAALGSLALPLAARGPAVPAAEPIAWTAPTDGAGAGPRGPRTTLILLDGASLEYIRTRSTEGRLANLSKLLASGASMYLATVRPTQPAPVWAAAMTGMYPAKNGVRSAVAYVAPGDTRPIALLPDHCFSHALVQLGVVRTEPATSESWRARPLWSILSNAGVTSGIVRLPLSYPARPVRGFVLADHFHDLVATQPFEDAVAYPGEVLDEARLAFADANEDAAAALTPEGSAARRDRLYSRAMRELQTRHGVSVAALRLQALDTAGHRLYDESQPSAFRDGSEAERRTRTQRLERAYADVDGVVGSVLETMRSDDLLLVVSGFGMQRLNVFKEVLARTLSDPVTRGTHERAPDGFLLAYGGAVQPGRRPRGSIVDVTPTLLYYLGLPIGRDMDGFARTDLFSRAFTAERPIAFIASHNR
jgi:predicted AlkP superfamily phosphohydrolase/phosphomutase